MCHFFKLRKSNKPNTLSSRALELPYQLHGHIVPLVAWTQRVALYADEQGLASLVSPNDEKENEKSSLHCKPGLSPSSVCHGTKMSIG